MTTNKTPVWNLTDLYRSPHDQRIERDLRACLAHARAFRRRYRGKIDRLTRSPQRFLAALRDFEKIQSDLDRLGSFAFLVFAADSTQPAHGALLQRISEQSSAIQSELVFFSLELSHLPATPLRRLCRNPRLAYYRHFLERQLAWKPHQLSETEEQLASEMTITGRGAFIRFFDEEVAAKRFQLGRKELTITRLRTLLSDRQRNVRRAALKAFNQGLKPEARRLTFVTNTLAADKASRDRRRHFPNPESARQLADELDPKIIELVSAVVARAYPLARRYYRLKAKLLGTKRLRDYDVSAPLGRQPRNIPFDRAQQIVLGAFAQFSPEYAAVAKTFFEQKWIDAQPRPGKRGGAFCAPTTPDHHPYILTNYLGTLRDVSTLAHELGHGVHGVLANRHSLFDFQAPLPIAETASVFSELLVTESLQRQLEQPAERLALAAATVENIFATVFRQITFYRFEQDLHRARRRQGELTTAAISELWRKHQRELSGGTIESSPGATSLGWMTIPHFIHSPFYVYTYAFGQLLTLALYQRYRQEGKSFVPKYFELLRAGGSASPQELLAPFRINLNNKAFWQGGIAVIEQLVQETKQFVKQSR